jgi:hypothetical protein
MRVGMLGKVLRFPFAHVMFVLPSASTRLLPSPCCLVTVAGGGAVVGLSSPAPTAPSPTAMGRRGGGFDGRPKGDRGIHG